MIDPASSREKISSSQPIQGRDPVALEMPKASDLPLLQGPTAKPKPIPDEVFRTLPNQEMFVVLKKINSLSPIHWAVLGLPKEKHFEILAAQVLSVIIRGGSV